MFLPGETIHWAPWFRTLSFCFYYPRLGTNFQEQKKNPESSKGKDGKIGVANHFR
jgi:hypothetical protein